MKNKITKNIALLLLLASVVLPTYAQTTPLEVKIVNESIEKKGDKVAVNLEFVFDDVAVRSNDMVIYTPVIVSAHNNDTRVELPSVLLTGNKRNKVLKREERLYGELSVATPQAILKKKSRSQQSIAYSTTLAYSDWMQGSTLAIETAVSGCAGCYQQADKLLVASNIMPQIDLPTFALVYIEPEVEEVKSRSDRHSATFNFPLNSHKLQRDFKDNRPKFEEVDRIIREVMSNDDIQITQFNIAGYASPEGSALHNKMLAEERAKIFAHYLVTQFNLSENKFRVESFGEDWDELQKAVEASNIADKAEILRIINTVENKDARDTPLRNLSNGNTYRTLLDQFYPPLRRTEYIIAYTVRSFDVEEAKEIINTSPKLLSLNEMYLVAQSYGAGTPQFKEVFNIAARTYPDSEIAILNSAATDIENNEIDRAINQMQKLGNNPRAWNNLGVAYALKGDTEKALELFSKAAAANDADAVQNLEKLREYMKMMQ